MLFEDPERRSTSVGVTVSPVRIASIEQFGDLATVGQRLLEAEGKKVCTVWFFIVMHVKRCIRLSLGYKMRSSCHALEAASSSLLIWQQWGSACLEADGQEGMFIHVCSVSLLRIISIGLWLVRQH